MPSPSRTGPWRQLIDKMYSVEQRLNAFITGSPWQTPSLTGFGANGSGVTVKYRLTNDGMVEIQGEMAATGNYTSGTTIWTVAAAYRPASDTVVGCVAATSLTTNIAGFMGIVSSTGAVNFSTNLSTGNVIIVNARYRLSA